MTIGIGVIGSGEKRGDTLILVADTMGTAQHDSSSTERLHKIFPGPDTYIVASGNMNYAADLVPRIMKHIDLCPVRKSDAILNAIYTAMFEYHKWRVGREVLSKYKLSDWEDAEGMRDLIRDECWSFNLGCELIIGTFDVDGRALLYRTSRVAHEEHADSPSTLVHVWGEVVPGFTVVGTGSDPADLWLNYCNHTLSYSDKRSAYHAYEAKRMAEKSPHVNERIEMLMATPHRYDWIHDRGPVSGDWSIGMFREMFDEFGPKDTDRIPTLAG
jgi:hypothetical protein